MDAPFSWRGQPPHTPPAGRGDTPRAPRLSHVPFKLVAKAKDCGTAYTHTYTHIITIAQATSVRGVERRFVGSMCGAAAGLRAAAQRGGGSK